MIIILRKTSWVTFLVKIPEKEYLKVSTKQKKISDLYCLFRLRNDFENMEKIEESIQEGLY